MKLLTTIRELFQHTEWADALVWQTVAASTRAEASIRRSARSSRSCARLRASRNRALSTGLSR